jgi:hypothetical protein
MARRASATRSSSLLVRFGAGAAAAELLFFGRGVAADATVVGSDFARTVFGAVVCSDERAASLVLAGSGALSSLLLVGRLTA